MTSVVLNEDETYYKFDSGYLSDESSLIHAFDDIFSGSKIKLLLFFIVLSPFAIGQPFGFITL